MYIYEIFDDGTSTTNPSISVDTHTVTLFLGNSAFQTQHGVSWQKVCDYILSMYPFRELPPRIGAVDPKNWAKFMIDGVANANAERYAAIRAILDTPYKPLDNYNMHEVTTNEIDAVNTTNTTAARTNTTNGGARSSSDTFGTKTDTSVYGATSSTSDIGARHSSDVIGAKTDETTNAVVGYDSAQFSNSDKTTSIGGQQTNTHDDSAAVDTVNTIEHTDTLTDSGHTDTHSADAFTDSQTIGGGTDTQKVDERTDKTTVDRTGNIGVTTSQQMALSELELRDKLRLIRAVGDDIIHAITVGVYSYF